MSPDGPKRTIQAGIDATSNGDTVIVADSPNEYVGPNNRDLDFSHNLPQGQTRAITVRSQSGDPANCIINCQSSGRAFWFHSAETATSIVQGFTIRNGYVRGDRGGAILCDGSSPKIVNCIFDGNQAEAFGTVDPPHGGGAIACYNGASPIIANCTFSGNQALGTASRGGALWCVLSRPMVLNCTLAGNSAGSNGGAMWFRTSDPILMRCQITANTSDADLPQAIYCEQATPTFLNCLIYQNGTEAARNGGAVACVFDANPTFSNCTMVENRAPSAVAGGLQSDAAGPSILTNCIIWGNTAGPTGQQIGVSSGTWPTVTYSDVQGGWTGPGHDNIDEDPLFVARPGALPPWDPPYYLALPGSPCRNRGGSTAQQAGLSNASTRIDLVPDGLPGDEPVDLGYHYPCDCQDPPNGNGIPDDWEIADGSAADCNHNGVPDACEGGAPADCAEVPCPGAYDNEVKFNLGTLINVSWDGYPLSRNAIARPLPFIWVPGSERGTILRVCTEDVPGVGSKGAVLGEYFTAPDNTSSSPSRTSVDLDGNVWVGNRGDDYWNQGAGTGSATRFGLVIGGQRCDANGAPNPDGQYLKPPFKYNTCIDRNGDGLLKTWRAGGDILPWRGAYGSVSSAQDECILNYVRVSDVTNIRHVSVDGDNNVWLGSFDSPHNFALVQPDSQISQRFTPNYQGLSYGGYGGLVGCRQGDHQILWSVQRTQASSGPLMRYDTVQHQQLPYLYPPNGYGLGIDFGGYIWNTQWSTASVWRFDPTTGDPDDFPAPGSNDRGVAVAVDDSFQNHVWIADSGAATLSRLDESENYGTIHTILLGSDGEVPTGVAVDHAGKVWTTCQISNTVKCVDPATNQVDWTVTLPAGSGPYSYSDMTGQVTLHTSATGTWNVIHDGQYFGAQWHLVVWNNREPPCPASPGTSLTVEVRASDFQTALAGLPFNAVQSGRRINGLEGRYIEVRVRFKGECPPSQLSAPSLCRLYVEYGLGDMNCDGLLNFDDIDAFVLALSNRTAYEAQYPNCDYWLADINSDGAVDFDDLDPFVALLSNPPLCN